MPAILAAPQALHIPDGFLSVPIALFFWGLAAAAVALAVRGSSSRFDERQIPLMGVMAAFIFAGQMINFPIAGGTSGHLLGGVLAAVSLGPWGGILVMATVVGVQSLIFQDGGLMAMGANIFNMGVVTVVIGYGLYRLIPGRGRPARLAAAGFAAWLSVVAAALLTALQLWASGIAALALVTPIMVGLHALIGLGEALITVFALTSIFRYRPELETQAGGGIGWAAAGLIASIAVLFLAPFASADPDGLERAAADLGFLGAAQPAPYALLPGYSLPFLGETAGSTILAGAAGLLVIAGFALWLAGALKKNSRV